MTAHFGPPGCSVPRGPDQPCPQCQQDNWIQRLALWHERDRYWSARRTCRTCGHQWTATWTETHHDPGTTDPWQT